MGKWIRVEIAKKMSNRKYFVFDGEREYYLYSSEHIHDGDYILVENDNIKEIREEKPNLATILKSLFLSLLIFVNANAVNPNQFNNFRYFDTNKLTNGNVDKQGTRNFASDQRNKVLKSPNDIKNRIGNKIRYDEKKVNGSVSAVQDKNTKQKIENIMSKINSSSTNIYKCSEKRIVNIKQLWQCSLTNSIFDNYSLCDSKCIKQHKCNQANCYQTALCRGLSGGYVCSIQMTQCQTHISCPTSGYYNANTGKCNIAGNINISLSASYASWIFKVKISGNNIQTAYGYKNPPFSSWINIYGNGNTWSGNNSSAYKIWIETKNGNIRLLGKKSSSGWVNFNSNFNISAEDGYGTPYRIDFKRSGNKFQVCVRGSCSNWTTGFYCPQGYVYNPARQICEANPIYSYTCPYAGRNCIIDKPGIAYCSPYNCNSTNIGIWCATGNINTSGMNRNNIGMWQCSYDGSWYVDAKGCSNGCNYWQCSYDGKWINGDYSKCKVYCREKGQCKGLN